MFMAIPNLISSIDELKRNLETVESYINEDANEDQFIEMASYIQRGHNFVVYRIGGETHFAPSRFVGYVDNTLEKQSKNKKFITGTKTDARLDSRLIGIGKKMPSEKFEKEYHKFCKYLNVTIHERERKFWFLDLDMTDDFSCTTPFFEGSVKLRLHKKRERNQKVVKLAKLRFKKTHGHLYCERCGFDFEEQYGTIGKDYIEAHHSTPISEKKGEYEIKPEHFKMLCSNCHTMVHRGLQID